MRSMFLRGHPGPLLRLCHVLGPPSLGQGINMDSPSTIFNGTLVQAKHSNIALYSTWATSKWTRSQCHLSRHLKAWILMRKKQMVQRRHYKRIEGVLKDRKRTPKVCLEIVPPKICATWIVLPSIYMLGGTFS